MRIVLPTLLFTLIGATAAAQATPHEPRPWTLDEAFAELRLNPRDPYLGFVVLQLARRAGRADEYAERVGALVGGDERRNVDLFDLFAGRLAVQESLQLDTMRGTAASNQPANADPATLEGPSVKSHPWRELLAGRQPRVSTIAALVPANFWLCEFRSVGRLLDVLDSGDLWATHVFGQTTHDGTSLEIAARLRGQLAIETTPILRPLYDRVVGRIGLCGSDLYLGAGTDVTVLFELSQPGPFRAHMDGMLQRALERHADADRSEGTLLDVPFVHVRTGDRAVHVFSAWPRDDLHVRSNSLAALRRVIAAIRGGDGADRLADTDELRYIRTLMPLDSEQEDGFVYLSDPLIRRLVGPVVKLTEQRRTRCWSNLHIAGHAALLYRTEHGRTPASLDALHEARCTPGRFGGELRCPDGGSYTLAADGLSALCSHHGHANALLPCLEIPVRQVTASEAESYRAFRAEYDRYWTEFFDPIALRIRTTPTGYRLETLILPLIDNSIYTGLAEALGGPTARLDDLPVPTTAIFSLTLNPRREALASMLTDLVGETSGSLGISRRTVDALARRGLGTQIGLHVHDASPMFDLSLPQLLGEMLGDFRGGASFDDDTLMWTFLLASLNAPVHASIRVEDAEIVDAFLAELDAALAREAREPSSGRWWSPERDFARLPDAEEHRVRSASIGFGPLKWRVFWARVDDALYVASKRSVLRDLISARPGVDPGPDGHAMVRLRPKHWNRVREDFELGWADNTRAACLNNLSPLSGVARALPEPATEGPEPALHQQMHDVAELVHGRRFRCPDGGDYRIGEGGRRVICSLHGTASAPRQPLAPARDTELGRMLARFFGATAVLTFLPEGLRAVVEIERAR